MKRILSISLLFTLLFLPGCGSTSASTATRSSTTIQPQGKKPDYSVYSYTPAPMPTISITFPTPPIYPYYSGTYEGYGLVWQETPGSSCFSYVGYDEEEEILAVIFRTSESRAYLYYDFSEADWDEFISADSLGTYYNKNIKGCYDSERIDDADSLLENGTIW